MKLREYKTKLTYIIYFLILITGIMMDIIVNITGIYCFDVTESFINTVYASIVTISVLSFSFIALISGMLDRIYCGFSLREILQFKESPANFKKYISVSLFTITVSTFGLLLSYRVNAVNSIIMMLLGIIFIEGKMAQSIYSIMTEDKFCYDLVIEHIRDSINKKNKSYDDFQLEIDKLTYALNKSITEKDKSGKHTVWGLLIDVAKGMQKSKNDETEYYRYYKYFYSRIYECIYPLANTFGYNDMAVDVTKIYKNINDFSHEKIDLLDIPLKKIQFWDDMEFVENDYFEQISEIYRLEEYVNGEISNEVILRTLYSYFNSIVNNQICSEKIKNQMIEKYMNRITKFYWKNNVEGNAPDSIGLLNIVRYFILKNENIKERNIIFEILVRECYCNNINSEKKDYYYFLALFFQSFYSYAFCEVETLNGIYREGLKNTFMLELSTSSIELLRASKLLEINIAGILNELASIIEKNEESRLFEHFPPYMTVKSVIWTTDFNIDYFLMTHVVFFDKVGYYSIYKFFMKWDEIEDKRKLNILKRMSEKFDYSSKLFKIDFISKCEEYGNFVCHKYKIPEDNQRQLYDHIRKEQVLLMGKILEAGDDEIEVDHKEVYIKLDELMKEEDVFGWNKDFNSDYYVKYFIPESLVRREYVCEQYTARTLQNGVLGAVNQYITKCTNELMISFDLAGINRLSSFLTDDKYCMRNYSYTEDWALKKFAETIEFKALINLESQIPFVNTPKIHSKIFFYKKDFKYNIKISKIDYYELDEKECAEYIEGTQNYNGLYNIDGVLMSKEQAINSIKKLFYRESISFKVMFSFGRNDITHIEYKL